MMQVKRLFFLAILLLLSFAGQGQYLLQGEIVDEKEAPVAFANIGLPGGRKGTVSDEAGRFALEVPDGKARLKISAVGYQGRELAADEFTGGTPLRIVLQEQAYALPKVEVNSREFKKERVLGNKSNGKNVVATFIRNELGTEIGAPIAVRREVWVKEARFNIAVNNLDTLFFRVNLYTLEDGRVGEKILRENVFIQTAIKEGEASVDLSPYNIVVGRDFLLCLEWVKDMGGGNISDELQFSGGPFNGPFYLRYASQSDWKAMGKQGMFNVGLGFNVAVRY